MTEVRDVPDSSETSLSDARRLRLHAFMRDGVTAFHAAADAVAESTKLGNIAGALGLAVVLTACGSGSTYYQCVDQNGRPAPRNYCDGSRPAFGYYPTPTYIPDPVVYVPTSPPIGGYNRNYYVGSTDRAARVGAGLSDSGVAPAGPIARGGFGSTSSGSSGSGGSDGVSGGS